MKALEAVYKLQVVYRSARTFYLKRVNRPFDWLPTEINTHALVRSSFMVDPTQDYYELWHIGRTNFVQFEVREQIVMHTTKKTKHFVFVVRNVGTGIDPRVEVVEGVVLPEDLFCIPTHTQIQSMQTRALLQRDLQTKMLTYMQTFRDYHSVEEQTSLPGWIVYRVKVLNRIQQFARENVASGQQDAERRLREARPASAAVAAELDEDF